VIAEVALAEVDAEARLDVVDAARAQLADLALHLPAFQAPADAAAQGCFGQAAQPLPGRGDRRHAPGWSTRVRQEAVGPAVQAAERLVGVPAGQGDHLGDLVGGEQIPLGQDQRVFGQEVVGAQRDAAQPRVAHQSDHQRATQPQPAGLGDHHVVDVVVGNVVHRQRAGDRHHAHKRQAGHHPSVLDGALPIALGHAGPLAPDVDDDFAAGQRVEAAGVRQPVRDEPARERGANRRPRRRHPVQIAVHLVGGQRVVEDIGVGHRFDDGPLERLRRTGCGSLIGPCQRRGRLNAHSQALDLLMYPSVYAGGLASVRPAATGRTV
jgi:hypothetical protein